MRVREFAEFTADFPDDSVEEDGEFIDWGGLNVAEVIAEKMNLLGWNVEEPEDNQFKGWWLYARKNGVDVNCRVQSFHPEFRLAIYETAGSYFQEDYLDFLTQLNRELISDPRFSDVVWKADNEVDRDGMTGSAHPVNKDEPSPRRPWWKHLLGLH